MFKKTNEGTILFSLKFIWDVYDSPKALADQFKNKKTEKKIIKALPFIKKSWSKNEIENNHVL